MFFTHYNASLQADSLIRSSLSEQTQEGAFSRYSSEIGYQSTVTVIKSTIYVIEMTIELLLIAAQYLDSQQTALNDG